MRGDIVYRIYGIHEGREKDVFFGAFRTHAEAEAEIAKLLAREMNGRNWAEQYHNRGFNIRQTVVQTDFEIPSRPKPRDRYFVRATPKENRPGTWFSTIVEVFRRTVNGSDPVKVCEYERNYSMLQTFEPFRQGSEEFALISPRYTSTSVLDLTTGSIVAEEPASASGFCPVGFYVPDWWDLHDDSIIPGSANWNGDREWPTGNFGFVWGCIWGDDNSWKVQYLDLSDIQSGVIRRNERFGYVELSTDRYSSPCLSEVQPPPDGTAPPPFIKLERWEGKTSATFAVEMQFEFETGQATDWKRLRNTNLD